MFLAFVTALRSEPLQLSDTIRKPGLQCRKYPLTKAFTIIKIRSATRPSSLQKLSKNIGRIMLEKYSSHQQNQGTARVSPLASNEEHHRKVNCPESGPRSERLRPFAPCKLSSCPLCKREHPRTSTRLQIPFHLYSP